MKLAEIFTDNMVLQANKPIRIFGTGAGKVEINFDGEIYSETFEGEKWVTELPSRDYGGKYTLGIKLNDKKITLKNVTFGDVFLFAGQSNVQFTIAEENPREKSFTRKDVRYYVQDRLEKHDGLHSADGWRISGDGTTDKWSALGYHFAVGYNEKKKVSTGVVGCFQGASVIRSWLPKELLDDEVYLPPDKMHGDYTAEVWSAWNGDSKLFGHTFLPVAPFAFKGVLWYQGESDTTVWEGKIYKKFLSRLVKGWRNALRDEELPFLIVGICDLDYRDDEGWHSIQRAQKEFAEESENVGFISSSDVCAHFDIH
ncbi:MAG: hypothetical protein J5903_01315, partial [Clostridia bacterium]|nr:hypothetical protein [Clostridia bacterium]